MLEEASEEIRKRFGVDVHALAKDLSTQTAAREIYDYTLSQNLTIYGLVNNAGFGLYGKFSETNLETELTMVNLHVATPISLTKFFLPGMLERNEGEMFLRLQDFNRGR